MVDEGPASVRISNTNLTCVVDGSHPKHDLSCQGDVRSVDQINLPRTSPWLERPCLGCESRTSCSANDTAITQGLHKGRATVTHSHF